MYLRSTLAALGRRDRVTGSENFALRKEDLTEAGGGGKNSKGGREERIKVDKKSLKNIHHGETVGTKPRQFTCQALGNCHQDPRRTLRVLMVSKPLNRSEATEKSEGKG